MSSCRWKRCTASFFDIPRPDELVFAGWFRGGELFRSGCCWRRRGQNLLFPARPRNQSGILPSRYPENHRKCGQVGRSRQLADHPRLLLHRRHHRIPGGQGPAHRPILSCSYIRSRVFSGGGCYMRKIKVVNTGGAPRRLDTTPTAAGCMSSKPTEPIASS